MKKLNESIVIDIESMKLDNSSDQVLDFNSLRDILEDEFNALVEPDEDGTKMIVSGASKEDVIDAAASIDGLENIRKYIESDGFSEDEFPAYEEVEDFDEEYESLDFPAWDEVNINEKRKGCCPPRKNFKGFRLFEALKAENPKDQFKLTASEKAVKAVLDDINKSTIGASEAREAFAKLKKENTKLKRLGYTVADVPGFKKGMGKLKKADADKVKDYEKFESDLAKKVNDSLKENKKCLHENVRINGKSLKEMSIWEIKSNYEKALSRKDSLTESLKEDVTEDTKKSLSKVNQLIEILDEEFTYRVVRQSCVKGLYESMNLNEDGEISDEELANLFGPAQGEEAGGDESSSEESSKEEESKEESSSEEASSEEAESDEEVELSRVEITLKNQEAADDLKQSCIDAEIPEDAIEIEDVEEESSGEESSSEESSSEEASSEEASSEEAGSEEVEGDEGANESIQYRNIAKLLYEGEEPVEGDDQAAEGDAEQPVEGDDQAAEGEEEEESEEKQVKFILTNTDYVPQLAKVLEDQYGISKDEFEDMIGGEIVEESSEDSEEATEDSGSEESSNEEGSSESEDSSSDDELDPSELFKGL